MSEHHQKPAKEENPHEEGKNSAFRTVLYTSLAGGGSGIFVSVMLGESRQELVKNPMDVVIFLLLVAVGNVLGIIVGHRLGNSCESRLGCRCILAVILAFLASLVLPIGYIVFKRFS